MSDFLGAQNLIKLQFFWVGQVKSITLTKPNICNQYDALKKALVR